MSEFKLYAEFNVPDAETAAKAQGAVGTSPYREDVFVYDIDPAYRYTRVAVPCEYFWYKD